VVLVGLLRKVWVLLLQFVFSFCSNPSQVNCHVTSRCSITPALRAYVGQFLSRGFVILLRKSIPQNRNLKTAAELGVMGLLVFVLVRSEIFLKARAKAKAKSVLVRAVKA